ncbi:MAG: aspartate-semialdehyde dehydrogenase [Calditrichia bacterium]|nr:aspartate-semialdehyde dehydrogenase [Calditrichia bacterium]
MNIAVVGATGLVGKKMIQVLQERNFPLNNFYAVASKNSVGKKVKFNNKEYIVEDIEEFDFNKIQLAIFSAGGSTSKIWAPRLTEKGIWVVDNSSAWRTDENVPLVVPEINPHSIGKNDFIIANPNCSTIQMVIALKPLDNEFNLRKVIVSTYQSVSGAGYKGVQQMEEEIKSGKSKIAIFPHQIAYNCIPQIGPIMDNGFTEEEIKMVNETIKILEKPKLEITPTTVRIPVVAGHSESVYAEFENVTDIETAKKVLSEFPGVEVTDSPENNEYPHPLSCEDKDEVFVGRIRKDLYNEKALNFWVVSDNLRKGAATNAIQIAEWLVSRKYIL